MFSKKLLLGNFLKKKPHTHKVTKTPYLSIVYFWDWLFNLYDSSVSSKWYMLILTNETYTLVSQKWNTKKTLRFGLLGHLQELHETGN